MSAISTTLPQRATYTNEPIFKLTVEQYHDLIERGKLTADDPVELIEGVLVFKMPKNPPHELVVGLVSDLLASMLPAGFHFRSQAPVTLKDSEPEPDGVIANGKRIDYANRYPGPADIQLLIEVADSTLERDRGMKLRSYARAGIVQYWIINLVDRQLEIFTQPDAAAPQPAYRATAVLKDTNQATVDIPGATSLRISVAEILPPI